MISPVTHQRLLSRPAHRNRRVSRILCTSEILSCLSGRFFIGKIVDSFALG